MDTATQMLKIELLPFSACAIGVNPLEILDDTYLSNDQGYGAISVWQIYPAKCCHVDAICDRRTDVQTDPLTTAYHGATDVGIRRQCRDVLQ